DRRADRTDGRGRRDEGNVDDTRVVDRDTDTDGDVATRRRYSGSVAAGARVRVRIAGEPERTAAGHDVDAIAERGAGDRLREVDAHRGRDTDAAVIGLGVRRVL